MVIRKICFMSVMLLMAQPVLAASTTVQEMAGVLVNLEHYPTATEKSRLMELAGSKSSTEQEKVVASAIANLSHSAADSDKPKLKRVIDDANTPAEVRDLAGIILNLNHKPSSTDKGKLHQMMK